MMPMTPSGTLTLVMRRPLGRVHSASTRPTGSGWAAMSSRPRATASSRFGSSARRSSKASPMPACFAAARSSALADRISLARERIAPAAALRAAVLAAAGASASRDAASRGRRPISAMARATSDAGSGGRCTRGSGLLGIFQGQQDLRHRDAVAGQCLLIGMRETDLAGRRRGLLFFEAQRAAVQAEMAAADRDRAGGNDNDLLPTGAAAGEIVDQRIEPGAIDLPILTDDQGRADLHD